MIARSRFFSVRKEPDFTTVRLDGDVSDSQLAEELLHQLATFIDDVGPVKLLVDFVDVESCPSAVIAALIAAQRRSEALGGQMKLSIPSDRIRAVFQRLNLNLLFDIYANRDDAICVCRDEADSN